MTTERNRSVTRALDILDLVVDCPDLGLSDIAKRCGLPVSSTFRILRTLEDSGHVERNAHGQYAAGPQMVWLGGRVVANDSLRRICRPGMARLAASTGESIYLSVRHGATALYIDVAIGAHGIQNPSWEGREIPLANTAAGRCLTGDLDGQPVAVVTSGVERGVTALAAPLVVDARPEAALSMVLPSHRLTPETTRQFGSAIRAAADRMSELLGADPPTRRVSRSFGAARRRAADEPPGVPPASARAS